MSSITLKSRAKINLSIDVLGKRQDGYHLVEMIMQTIDLYDLVKVTEIKNDEILIKSNSVEIPLNSDNITYKAANLIKNRFNINKGVEIFIQKNIPIAAGIAGGSSNAAAVLVGLNKLWDLGLDINDLEKLGVELGADVPFSIRGGACLAEGIGEELTSVKGLNEDVSIVICKPDILVSTKDIYQNLNLNKITHKPDNKYLIECLQRENVNDLSKNMVNVLEGVTVQLHPIINDIEKLMIENNALGSMMSGSGPTVFGIFSNEQDAKKCKDILEHKFKQTFIVKSTKKGVEIDGEYN